MRALAGEWLVQAEELMVAEEGPTEADPHLLGVRDLSSEALLGFGLRPRQGSLLKTII